MKSEKISRRWGSVRLSIARVLYDSGLAGTKRICRGAGVHSRLVAAFELTAVKSTQVIEHDLPSAAKEGASEKEHNLCGLAFPKDTRRLQA
jgi:hypothetical protein